MTRRRYKTYWSEENQDAIIVERISDGHRITVSAYTNIAALPGGRLELFDGLFRADDEARQTKSDLTPDSV